MTRKHSAARTLLCSALLLPFAAGAMAQDETPVVPEPPQMPDTPLNGDGSYSAQWSSPEFAQIAGMLAGTWKSNAPIAEFASEDSTNTLITFTPVKLDAYPDAMYVEVAAQDVAYEPYYQAVLQFWKRGSTVHLRTLELKDETRQGSMTGMWMYPGFFPGFKAEDFRGTLDMAMSPSGNGWTGKTSCAYPVNERGAVEMTSELRIEPGSLQVADRFFDAAGAQVSGPAAGSFYGFSKADHPFVSEQVIDGVWRITMLDLDEGKALAEGDTVGFRYWGYLHDSDNPGYLFDSSENPGRSVLQFVAPGRLINGLQPAIMGLQAGEWHKFVIRSDQGYLERTAAGGTITPWSDLIFTFQTQYVQAPPPPPEPVEQGPTPVEGAADAEQGEDGSDE